MTEENGNDIAAHSASGGESFEKSAGGAMNSTPSPQVGPSGGSGASDAGGSNSE